MFGPLAASTALFAETKIGGPAWLPTSVAGLQVWYKADALALTDGAAVVTISDNSGNSRDAVQSNSLNQAVFKVSIQNGKPGIFNDGSKNITYPLPNSTILDNLGNYTFFAVGKVTNAALGANAIFGKLSGSKAFSWHNGGGYFQANDTNTTPFEASNFGNFNDGVTHVLVLTVGPTYGFSDVHLYKDNVSQTATNESNGTPTNISSTSICAFLSSSGGGNGYIGYMFEAGAYNSVLSSVDRGKLITYLNSKWAVF